MKKIKYPEDFYDYNGGVKMSDKRIEEMVNEVFQDDKTVSSATGDTIVINIGDSVIVAKNYQKYERKE